METGFGINSEHVGQQNHTMISFTLSLLVFMWKLLREWAKGMGSFGFSECLVTSVSHITGVCFNINHLLILINCIHFLPCISGLHLVLYTVNDLLSGMEASEILIWPAKCTKKIYNFCKVIKQFVTLIQGVRMKGIQNKIIIYQKAFIIHIYGLPHYKGNYQSFFLSI
jgi:hypothetical protein